MNSSSNPNVGMIKSQNTENEIYFNFSYSALKLLGKNLYNNAANAISELVANALDAKATSVYVYIDMSDKEHSTVEIVDDGIGMSYDDLADKYVWVGRNKRDDKELSDKERESVMGRKGIGKLAALYLSNEYYIVTKKASDIADNRWKVNLSSYRDSDFPRLNRVTESILFESNPICNDFRHGTMLKLTNVDLRRNGEKKIEGLRRTLADFYLLNALQAKIFVAIKSKKDENIVFHSVEKRIAYKNFYAMFDKSDMNISSKMSNEIAFTWLSSYEHIANEPRKTICLDSDKFDTKGKKVFHKEDGSEIEKEYELTGWIGIHSTIEVKNAIDERFIRNDTYQANRLRLYVRNKLAVANYFDISPSTQTMSNYIEGEISFNILDDDDLPDIATSSRQDFLDDERVELLISVVDPILRNLYSVRNDIGQKIRRENEEYQEKLFNEEKQKKEEEERARVKAENEARLAEKAKKEAEEKRKEAEIVANRERQRSKYILNLSGVEDKNIMNSIHSIYNMSNRVKENLDALNCSDELSEKSKRKLEKASTSNQRIISVSKLISKAGKVIDNNDAIQQVNLSSFVREYVENVLCHIYSNEDIIIKCLGDISSEYIKKIKPLSFIMVIDNLVGNAIKAKATNLDIEIDDSNTQNYLIKFIDNGRGIDKTITNKEHLFEFGITTTNGSGLGLFYAKKQIEEMGGNIIIEENEAKGITIILKWKK